MTSDGIGPKGPAASYGLRPEALGDLVDETSTGVIEVTGTIKWFDVSKGYGFIVPDNGLPDVLLHVTCLRRDGFQTAYEGARVVWVHGSGQQAAAQARDAEPGAFFLGEGGKHHGSFGIKGLVF